MARKGYEVDEVSSRKAMYSLATGVFTSKQIHTIVFARSASSMPVPEIAPVPEGVDSKLWEKFQARGNDMVGLKILVQATGRTITEVSKAAKSRGIKVGELVGLYLAGEVPELGEPPVVTTPTPAASEPPPAEGAASGPAEAVGSVADELAKLSALRDSSVLTEDEFDAQKAKLLEG